MGGECSFNDLNEHRYLILEKGLSVDLLRCPKVRRQTMRHQQRQHHMQQDKDREVSVNSETVYSDKDGGETKWQVQD